MPTKTNKTVKKKATTKKVTVSMTLKQAEMLQAFAAKNQKTFKFLDAKLVAAKA